MFKDQAPVDPVAGERVSWELGVENAGPSTALDAVVEDTLPALGLTGITLPDDCTIAGLVVTCQLGDIPPGSPRVARTIEATIPEATAAGTTITNTARVTSATPDPSESTNVATTTGTVRTEADITVTKTGTSPTPAGAGLPTFTITVANEGLSVAHDVHLTDTLPFDAIIETVTPAACTFSGIAVDCALGDLAPGAPPVEIEIEYFTRTTVPPGDYTNTATATSATSDPDPDDNDGSVTVEVLPPDVDVTVAKTGTSPVVAGGRFDYEIDVQNEGPSTAFDVVVTDALPIGFTPEVATTEFGACTITGQIVRCEIPFVFEPPFQGDNAPVIIQGSVDPDAPDSVTNTATAATTEPDRDPLSNTSSMVTAVTRESSLTITKEAGAEFVAGGAAAYAVTVTNAGPSAAAAATVTDILPAGVTLVPAESDSRCGVAVNGNVLCDLGTIGPGVTEVVRVVGRIDPNSTAASLENRASVTSTSADPDSSDNTSVITTPLIVSADLASTKTAASDVVVAGSEAVFNVTVTNEGPSTARSVELLDVIPPTTSFVAIETTPALPCTETDCDLGDLLPGESVSAVVTVAVPASHPPGPITNLVNADSPTPDPNPGRRVAEASTEVVLEADVSVVKTVVTSPIVAGLPVTYNFVVHNAGPSDAINTTLVDPFPPGTVFIGGTAPPGTVCEVSTIDTPAVSCVLPRLAAGETVSGQLVLATSPELTAILSNTTVVGAEALDRDDSDNTSTASAPVVAADSQVDLVITKTGPSELVAGEAFEYTITVANEGVSISTTATVTDELPAGLEPTSASVDGTPCTIAGRTVTCTVGTLLPDDPPAVMTIAGNVLPSIAGDSVTNMAEATPAGTDLDPTDNRAATTATIRRAPAPPGSNDVAVTVTADQSQVSPGAGVSFTVRVTNHGPQVAPDVVLANVLPRELLATAPSGPGNALGVASITPPAGCTGIGINASCSLGALAVGQTITLQFSGTVPAGTPADTRLVNTATVTTSGLDAVAANNVDSDVIVVVVPAVTTTTVRPTGDGGGSALPATGAVIGALLVLGTGFILLGGGLRTAGADRLWRRRRR